MFRLIFSYFAWHYSFAIKDILTLFKNFLWFIFHFFSISVLFKTLLSPWQKLDERYRGGFNISAFFETVIVNILMRFVGFFIRMTVIIIGIIVLLIALCIEILAFAAWLLLPFAIVLLFISGIRLLM